MITTQTYIRIGFGFHVLSKKTTTLGWTSYPSYIILEYCENDQGRKLSSLSIIF